MTAETEVKTMTTGHIIQSIIEGLVVIGLIIGFIFEDRFIAFEERLVKRHKARKNRYASYNPVEGLYWR